MSVSSQINLANNLEASFYSSILVYSFLPLIHFFMLLFVHSFIHYSFHRYKSSGKKNMSLLTSDDQPHLEPTEHTIVPL